jgi:predicted ester cyclase
MTTRREALLALLGAAAVSASAHPGDAAEACPSPESEAVALRLLERYVVAANAHDTSDFPNVFAEGYIQHSGRSPSGLAAQIDNAKRLSAALPDRRLVVEDRIVGGDKLVARCTYTGTHLGPFRGFAPTGKVLTIRTIDIWRIEGGKLAEHWDVVDFAEVEKQIRGG